MHFPVFLRILFLAIIHTFCVLCNVSCTNECFLHNIAVLIVSENDSVQLLCNSDVSGECGGLSEGHAAAAVVGSAELRRRLLRREEQQRLRPAVVAATVCHDRRHVSAADRLRASTVSLPQSRDQRARVTSAQRRNKTLSTESCSKERSVTRAYARADSGLFAMIPARTVEQLTSVAREP